MARFRELVYTGQVLVGVKKSLPGTFSNTVNIKPLIILLSFLLVISPVSVAYSALMSDNEQNQTSHCEQSTHDQDEMSCCQDDQCNNSCLTMQCNHFGKLSGLSEDDRIVSSFNSLFFTVSTLTQVLDKGSPNIPLRPPIVTL